MYLFPLIILLKISKTHSFLQLISLNVLFFWNSLHLKCNRLNEKSTKHALFCVTDFLFYFCDWMCKYVIVLLKIGTFFFTIARLCTQLFHWKAAQLSLFHMYKLPVIGYVNTQLFPRRVTHFHCRFFQIFIFSACSHTAHM